METVIKWSGSKRSQAKKILTYFPENIETYYELFLGGGSILLETLENNTDLSIKNFIVNDLNSDLIELWKNIKNNTDFLIKEYTLFWNELNKDDNGQRRKDYFNLLRKEFNLTRKPEYFLILNRIVINGLIRYNKKYELNSTFHFSRPGIHPENLSKILHKASKLLNNNNVIFNNKSYLDFNIEDKNSLIYLDPPYFNTKNMYYGTIEFETLINWLYQQNSKILLSYDGIRGENNMTVQIPKELFQNHHYIESGISSFNRLINNKQTNVLESLYTNF